MSAVQFRPQPPLPQTSHYQWVNSLREPPNRNRFLDEKNLSGPFLGHSDGSEPWFYSPGRSSACCGVHRNRGGLHSRFWRNFTEKIRRQCRLRSGVGDNPKTAVTAWRVPVGLCGQAVVGVVGAWGVCGPCREPGRAVLWRPVSGVNEQTGKPSGASWGVYGAKVAGLAESEVQRSKRDRAKSGGRSWWCWPS